MRQTNISINQIDTTFLCLKQSIGIPVHLHLKCAVKVMRERVSTRYMDRSILRELCS